MNFRTPLAFGLCLASLVLSSCSLPSGAKLTLADPLKEGVRYEVRRAVGSEQCVQPWEMRTTYFVLRPESPPSYTSPTRGGSRLMVNTTAYCHVEKDHLRFGSLSAIGRPLKYGVVRSAAADWSRYPLGTRFRIRSQPGVIYEVDDYGSALVGSNTIDLYCPTRSLMNRWGARKCDIEVVSWGSFTHSLSLMRDRIQFPHVRAMVRSIQSRFSNVADATKPATRLVPTYTFTSSPRNYVETAGRL
jgi:3D (Asp-Asp-Asp) domain-containing protein